MSTAIEIRDVSKHFRLYHEHYSSLKERMLHAGRAPYEMFMALRDIDFDVEEGTTVGLLGANGSGKSTLLKCIGGILQPTYGEIHTHGRLAALLELGAGFNPELTGRENIFMNASILGLSKRDTERVFDDIVAFAELEKFIDMQVRHYSSGMYIRLGFAVAVNVDPDILLVDEVLSVGDESFQRKCLDRVARFQRDGKTILFVTHAVDLVRRICDRAIVLDHGEMVTEGTPGEAVRAFRETLQPTHMTGDDGSGASGDPTGEVPALNGQDRGSLSNYSVRITEVTIEHPGLRMNRSWLLPDEPMSVCVKYHANERVDDLRFGIAIYDEDGNHLYGTNTALTETAVPAAVGDGEVAFQFEHVPLLDGTYHVTLAIESSDEGTVYDWREQQYHFSVMNPTRAAGLVSFPVEVRFTDRDLESSNRTA
jgi:ABC-2 type transport system ATP-binding protein